MADEQARPVESVEDFFLRSGLISSDQIACYHFIEVHFPGKYISPVSCQGYCSFTVIVGDDRVVQFRPDKYRLNLEITTAARRAYGSFAPATRYIATIPTSGLLVYCMDRISGVSLKDFRKQCTPGRSFELRANLCRDFATLLSKGWHQGNARHTALGIVGKSIASRLNSLSKDLPLRFQPTARNIVGNLSLIEALPWVLSHGDIVAGNVMVDPSSGRLLGLVDWAEAERLPFGITLYGLEEFLGEMTVTGFQYHQDASDLRKIFWEQLMNQIPELHNSRVVGAVKLARDLGVLLWHGIAFDNGAIDRVVEEGKDVDEIYRLDAFLDISSSQLVDISSDVCYKRGIAMVNCGTVSSEISSSVLST